MKKIIVLLLVCLMVLSTSVFAFAEDGARPERREKTEEQKEQREEKRAEVIVLFETHNPSSLDDYNSVILEHKEFHEMVRAEKEVIKAEHELARDELKATIENDELTEEEIAALIEEAKSSREAFKALVDPIRESKKEDAEANKLEVKSLREELKVALDNEVVDSEVVAVLLNQMVDLLEEHVDIDLYYYELLSELRDVN